MPKMCSFVLRSSIEVSVIDVISAIFLLASLTIFTVWLVRTNLGLKALDNTRLRRNCMPFFVPLLPFFVWLTLSLISVGFVEKIKCFLTDYEENFLSLVLTLAASIPIVLMIAAIVHTYFARGLRGIGLDYRTSGRDFWGAVVKLLGTWAVVGMAFILTLYAGKLIAGEDFEIQRHEGLEIIREYPEVAIRILMIVVAVVAAPIIEEMLFRGMLQTMLRNYISQPWAAITIASVFFTMSHENLMHWPALFALAMGLGYAYEKSGSLLQAIFMHAIFNGVSIAGTLLMK